MLFDIFCVCIGGAFGAVARWQIAKRLDCTQSGFPLGTFVANMIASFMLGIIILLSQKFNLPKYIDLFLEVGFCATLSTFSSLAWQIADMLQHKKFALSLFYASTTMLCGMILFEIAYHLA